MAPKSGRLAQLPLLLEDSKRKDEIFLFTQDWVLSLDINRFQDTYMKGRSSLPNDPKIIVCICFGAFWICKYVLPYGRLTIDFGIVAFAKTRWLFSYGATFLPDARGVMSFYSVC